MTLQERSGPHHLECGMATFVNAFTRHKHGQRNFPKPKYNKESDLCGLSITRTMDIVGTIIVQYSIHIRQPIHDAVLVV